MSNRLAAVMWLVVSCGYPSLPAIGTDAGGHDADTSGDGRAPDSSGQSDAGSGSNSNCAPGAATCTAGTLTVCNPDGTTTTMTACALGCEATGASCKTFTPSNGLGPALASASSAPDVVFPSSVNIDTDTGSVTDMAGVPVTIESVVVTQTGAPAIRAFIGHSFDITDAKVTGSDAVAFVSVGGIDVHGKVDASGHGVVAGPGALAPPSTEAGGSDAYGGGGGGNATIGGSGTYQGIGGAATTVFTPLGGGGHGGACTDTADSVVGTGGGGGGAVQFVSLASVDVQASGIVDVGGGGGGADGGGGGAGGTVIFETPALQIDGIVAANGGGGAGYGTCGNVLTGSDGTLNMTPASGGGCPAVGFDIANISKIVLIGYVGGSGGTVSHAAAAAIGSGFSDKWAGGGGAVGRVEIVTLDGTFMQGSGGLVAAAPTTGVLAPH